MAPSGLGAALDKQEGVGDVYGLDGEVRERRYNELLTPLHDSRHRWVFFPNQKPEEVLVFKIGDSRRIPGLIRRGAHTAFKDPTRPLAVRKSIETRAIVFLKKEASAEAKVGARL